MPNALIITTAGTNCDLELAQAFETAGAEVESLHLNAILKNPERIEDYDLIGLPGGFSYGDAIAAGRIKAQLMRRHLYQPLVRAIQRGTPIIAPCNGFQVLAQMGLLPGPMEGEPWPETPPTPTIALAQNEAARFVDCWSRMKIPPQTNCIWTKGLNLDEETGLMPSAHGEGRFTVADPVLISELEGRGQIAVCYAADDNPNGSTGNIAGICDASGLVLGLMPHPERFTRWTQHPWWTRLNPERMQSEPLGVRMFRNAVAQVAKKPAYSSSAPV